MKRSLSRFNQYIAIFDKKTESIILDLKKASFALANEGEEGSEADAKDNTDEADADQLAIKSNNQTE